MASQRTDSHSFVRRTLVGVASALALTAGAVAAVPPPTARADDGVLAVVSRIAAIRDYWTPARMRAAIPVESPSTTSTTARTTARTTSRTTGLTANTLPTGADGVYTPRTVGKLFFKDGSSDYVCSAAAILTKSRNQVLTAGHCVNSSHTDGGLLGLGLLGRPPHYYSDWMYVPRYSDGRAPLGKWVATAAYATSGWINQENFQEDQGILTMAPLHGHRLVAVTGGNRVAIGAGTDHAGVRIWGWPAESPYDGAKAWRCDGATRASSVSTRGDSSMTCGLNGGASGGPWLLGRDRTGNVGTIFAVTSRITTTGPHLILAQPLPASLRTLIARAGG